MMKYFIQMTALLFILICFSATAAEQGTSIVATVNGEAITLGQVLSESSGGEAAVKSYAGGEAYTTEISKLRQAAVDRIIDRKLLIGEFKRLKLVLPKNYVESMLDNLAVNLGCKSRSELAAKARSMNTSIDELREKASERLMAEMVMGREFYAAGTPTPKEINEYFVKNQARFSQDEKVKLALLLLPENSPQTTVDELALQLKKDHRRFAELVKAFSCGPNREQGGAVGFIERKNLRKEFAGVLPTGEIKADQVYGPVKTPEGRYFIKIMEVIPGKQAKLADHRHAIRQELENQAKEKALEALKKRLRDRASIRYYYGSKAAENKSAAVENKNSVKTEKIPSKQPIKKMEKKTMVTLKTNHGDIKLELFADAAPKTVANFLEYVKSGFYNGTLFHRVIDNFMIQGGGFDQNFKQKKTREPIENEADNRLSNEIGTIAMARTMDPHSATAQFFINVANNDFLDFRSPSPQFYGYCVFGKVVEGMDVVNKIKTVKTGGRAGHQDVPKEDVVIIEAVAE